ncbi:MAG: DUF2007 domain-containing protein [Chloroflexi bacterium]|nr:DUF2007 domain-containing protein [Chloroflexota bacterium]
MDDKIVSFEDFKNRPTNWVLVARAFNLPEASIYLEILKDAKIPCIYNQHGNDKLFGVSITRAIEIYVPEAFYDEALAVLEQH